MIRMLIIGYCLGLRSDRRLCDEAYLNLAYRWFCRFGLEGAGADHSTFFQEPPWPIRESDLLRGLFQTTVTRERAFFAQEPAPQHAHIIDAMIELRHRKTVDGILTETDHGKT